MTTTESFDLLRFGDRPWKSCVLSLSWRQVARCCLGLALLLCLLGSCLDARAEWKTETYDFVPGWNSVFLHIDPSQETIEVLLQRTPISEVWLWLPAVSTAQFITSIQDSTDFGSNWISWDAAGSNTSTLEKFVGNAAYLFYVEESYHDGMANQEVSEANPFTLLLTGKAVPPAYTWTASGQNFIGFSTRASFEPSFENFFGLANSLDTSATEVYQYTGGELGTSNPLLVDAPINTRVERGRAYWLRDTDYNRFFGTFSLTLQDSAGVHFGANLSSYSIRLSNTANQAHTVTLELVASESPADGSVLVGAPAILVRGDYDSQTFTFPFADLATNTLSWTLEPEGGIGSSVEIVLGIDRASMGGETGDVYGAILRFTDNINGTGYTQIDIPATAIKGSMAGLWVGEAEITQVQQTLSDYEVDEDGATALNEDGSAVVGSTDVTFGDVARSYPLRLIMHMDEDGNTQLLQRVYYGLDEDANPMLATNQGALNAEHLDVARRITSVHLPWSEENTRWMLDGPIDHTGTLSTMVTTAYTDQAASPFLHTYHPDHDNKDAEFSGALDRGYESYDIVREITLNSGTTLVVEETSSSSSDEVEGTEERVDAAVLPTSINMLSIPQGRFTMGNEDAVGPLAADHGPERLVYISPFEMSEAEITVQQYVDYLNAAVAEGKVTLLEDSDGTFVVGAEGKPYDGLKFIELSGDRVMKDHDGDGDVDPENPLNQCWIELASSGFFEIKDPQEIDWEGFEFSDEAELITPSEWTEVIPENTLIPADTPGSKVILDGDTNSGKTYQLDGARQMVLVDDYAFVVSSVESRLHAIKISDPVNPELISVGKYSLSTPIHISTDGDYLFVCSFNENSVRVFKISDLTGSNSTPGSVGSVGASTPRATAISGSYLYSVGDDAIVRVFNLSPNPESPAVVDAVTLSHEGTNFSGRQRWIEIEDQQAYITDLDGDSVIILDLSSDPTDVNNVAYVLSDGGTDAVGNTISLLDGVAFCHIADGILYVSATVDNAVSVFDVSYEAGVGPITDNEGPVLIATMQHGVNGFELENARQMVVADNNVLYVGATSSDTVNIVNVSDPTAPILIDVYAHNSDGLTNFNGPQTMQVDDKALYVLASTSDAMHIFPLTRDSELPDLSGSSEGGLNAFFGDSASTVLQDGATDSGDDETFSFQDVRHVVASENVACVADRGGDTISILDIQDPQNVELLATIVDEIDGYKIDNVSHLTLAGDLLVATSNQDGEADTFTLIDVSTPSAPVRHSTITDNVQASNLNAPLASSVWSHYLFVSDIGGSDEDAISIFDISDPGDPQLINEVISGELDSNGETFRVGNSTSIPIVDGIAYIGASENQRISILDVNDPTNVKVLAEIVNGENGFDFLANIQSIVVKDGILYCSTAGTQDAIIIIDIGDPTNPALLSVLRNGDGIYDSLNDPRRIVVENGLLYIPAEGSSALTVVNVVDPSNPVLLEVIRDGDAGFESLGGAASVAVDQELVLLASSADQAVTIIQPLIEVGETIDVWPELTRDLPTLSEISTWPATFIKWHGAKAFAEYYGCDLPTEAQWEYSAKGGTDFDFATADGLVDATRANYNEYNSHPDTGHVEPVKSYASNPFGLYDMSGNVWEWCRDWYDPAYYSGRPNPDYDPYNDALVLGAEEPSEDGGFVGGPGQDYTGDARVKRGGSWNFHETSLLTSERERDYTWRGNDHFGFRIVRDTYNVQAVELVDFTALTSSGTQVNGTYQERITLKGKDDEQREYNVAGEFKIIRISDISTLKTD